MPIARAQHPPKARINYLREHIRFIKREQPTKEKRRESIENNIFSLEPEDAQTHEEMVMRFIHRAENLKGPASHLTKLPATHSRELILLIRRMLQHVYPFHKEKLREEIVRHLLLSTREKTGSIAAVHAAEALKEMQRTKRSWFPREH